MKFTVNKMSLQSALQQLSKVTPTRSTLPILSSVYLSAKDGTLTLRATDLEISQIITVDAKIADELKSTDKNTFGQIRSRITQDLIALGKK